VQKVIEDLVVVCYTRHPLISYGRYI